MKKTNSEHNIDSSRYIDESGPNPLHFKPSEIEKRLTVGTRNCVAKTRLKIQQKMSFNHCCATSMSSHIRCGFLSMKPISHRIAITEISTETEKEYSGHVPDVCCFKSMTANPKYMQNLYVRFAVSHHCALHFKLRKPLQRRTTCETKPYAFSRSEQL